jgi:uncharacterized integral membrane protein
MIGTKTHVQTTTHHVIGDRDEVAAALHRAQQQGRLHGVTDVRPLAGHQVELTAYLSDQPTEPLVPRPARTPWQRIRPWLEALAVLAGLAAVAGLVWLIVLAVLAVIALAAAVVAWIGAHWLLILIIAVALLFLGGGTAHCAGTHCGGCRG